jgi:hypothetical protein
LLDFGGEQSHYHGIYYNKSSELIYVGTLRTEKIDIFNCNLELVGIIRTPGNNPYTIAEYDNKLFVGTYGGNILVIENGIITQNFTTVCSNIYSIMLDSYGYMLVVGRKNDNVSYN